MQVMPRRLSVQVVPRRLSMQVAGHVGVGLQAVVAQGMAMQGSQVVVVFVVVLMLVLVGVPVELHARVQGLVVVHQVAPMRLVVGCQLVVLQGQALLVLGVRMVPQVPGPRGCS